MEPSAKSKADLHMKQWNRNEKRGRAEAGKEH